MSSYKHIAASIPELTAEELAKLERLVRNERQRSAQSKLRKVDLDREYAAMASDNGREAAALEWSDALFPGVADETW